MLADYKLTSERISDELFQDTKDEINDGTRVLGSVLGSDEACSNYVHPWETKYLTNFAKHHHRMHILVSQKEFKTNYRSYVNQHQQPRLFLIR